jgi:DNA-binding response OmpR family regulator
VVTKSALVVDDDPIIRNLIATLLRRREIASEQAANGDEAIALLATGDAAARYSVVILDMMMPKSSGWDVLSFLERERPALLPRVVIVSAAGESMLEPSSTRGRCVLHKPFNADELYAVVASCSDDQSTQPDGVGIDPTQPRIVI